MRVKPRSAGAPGKTSARAGGASRPRGSERLELDRIRRVYAVRSARGKDPRYSAYAMPALLALYQRERMLLAKLGATCEKDLHELEILDVGCGSGGDLVRLVGHDADPARIHGIDLRADVIATARQRLPSVDVRVGNAAELPHPDRSMDLILQSTVLSSVLDAGLRRRIAAEMMRVVRPTGLIVSYDFWINPLNRDTRGVSRRELRRLFPSHRVEVRSATLMPPIARLVAPRSYTLAAALQAVPVLRTHIMAFITPGDLPAS